MAHSITILIPVYNEADNLSRLGAVLKSYVEEASVPAEVLFINDGSEDNSQSLIEELCLNVSSFHFIQLEENVGLSAALKAGIDQCNSALIGYMDADLQTVPEDFELLLEHIDNYELVTGIRKDRKDPFLKRMASKIANSIRRWFTKDGMTDTGCPLKVMKTDYAKKLPLFKGLHRFIPALILVLGGRVKQVPVRHFPRHAGYSKFGIRSRMIRPLIDCFAFLWIKRRYISYNIKRKS